ncbi:MAG: hypothetical protein IJV98_05735 [Clostridia bacterium]|nr:hypothetical protein [Clostridia bacterium]
MKVTRELGTVLKDTTMRSPVYISVTQAPMTLYGLHEPFRRIPESVASAANSAVLRQYDMTPSVRVRFRTNSDYIVIHADLNKDERVGSASVVATSSFEMHFVEDGKHVFKGIFVPSQGEGKSYVECRLKDTAEMKDVVIFFPICAAPENVYVGLREGSEIEEGGKYTHETPVVFYGSSIVHGIGASRPGMNYPSQISRMLDTDVWNLGFGGGALAEDAVIDYIADQTMSVFVYDYDHNAPDPEFLEKTHYAGYRRFREKQPTTPIIMASKPGYHFVTPTATVADNERRRTIIRDTYLRAKAEGDENVWFIDGSTFYPEAIRGDCTNDGCHPNDLGYHYMAEAFASILKKLIQ